VVIGSSNTGAINLAGRKFFWASVPVVGLPLQLVLLDSAGTSGNALTATLNSRFLTASIIMLWVAVWVALLFASVISRKLNEKNAVLRHQITHDTLTGLPNRSLLYEQLSESISTADATVNIALLVIDINRFKEINDFLPMQTSNGHTLTRNMFSRPCTSLLTSTRLSWKSG
jgi:predicted signal transduction protein with EAL and GGDEF domain